MPPQIDREQAARFIETLTGSRDSVVCWQTFDDGPEKDGRKAANFHARLSDVDEELARKNATRCGIFLVPNLTNGEGRHNADIVAPRACFVDGDNMPMPEVWALPPSMIVRRDNLHWHAYWLVDPLQPIAAFRPAQARLIAHYGTDPAIKDEARVMRVPGFIHAKGDPVSVELVEAHPERVYTFDAITAAHAANSGSPAPSPHRVDLNAEITHERNNALIRIGGSLRARGLDHNMIETLLLDHNNRYCVPPLADAEVKQIARNASKYAARHPLTEMGNASRMIDAYGQDFRWCGPWGHFLIWNGRHWAEDETGLVSSWAWDCIHSLTAEAIAERDHDRQKGLMAHAMRSQTAKHLQALVDLIKTRPEITTRPTKYDTDVWLLNCENGTVNLKTGTMQTHRREDFITLMAPVQYAAGAQHAVLDRYLTDVTGGDAEFRAFLQRAVGYTLTGCSDAEVLFALLGDAATGKTTLLEAVKAMLGDYGATSDFDAFSRVSDGGSARGDIARTKGKRLIACSELNEGQRFNAKTVKSMTGGEMITARFLYGDEFEFMPSGKVWIAANHAPKVNDADNAMWRRIIRLPFTNVVPEAKRDPQVKEALRTDPQVKSALLAWALHGCLDWQARGGGKRGLAMPEVIAKATQEYRDGQNPLRAFFDACCDLGPELTAPVSDLRRAYVRWAADERVKQPLGLHEFNQRLELAGCRREGRRIDSVVTKVWAGVAVTTSDF